MNSKRNFTGLVCFPNYQEMELRGIKRQRYPTFKNVNAKVVGLY